MSIPQVIALSAAAIVGLIYLWPLLKYARVIDMLKHATAAAVIVGVVVAFYPKSPTAEKPEVVLPPVTVALASATRDDKAKVKALYVSLADVVERDESVIATMDLFRTVHGKSLDLAFQKTPLKGKYDGLDTAIDAQLKAAVGTGNVALTPEKRKELVSALRGVADACR
jgi:site-specific recombinase